MAAFLLDKGESTHTMLDPKKYPGSLLGPATLDQRPYTDTAGHLEGRPAWHTALARRICQGCPVRVQCLTWAVETGEAEGMWGGTTPDERRRIRATHERRAAWPLARPWEELPPVTATRVE